jgi:DNA relaxase NicK
MAAWIGLREDVNQIYIEGKGDTSPALANAIRSHFPAHNVPRADVCEDVDEEGAFERLQALIRANKGPKVKAGYVALPDDVEDGRTWSAGVRGGVAYLRLYEAGKHPDRIAFNRPNWVRPELEVRPQYARDKAAAATMQPIDFWGMAAWSQKVGQAITGLSINRFEPEVRKFSQDKTLRYVSLTFRRLWEEMLQDGEDIGRSIRQCIQEEDEFIARHGGKQR